ncbi:MAG: hypothetical protein GY832_10745, partial [Chloroflexi bacterium]|nr:hypothetical protein [Chloroflexota bacterium]
MNLWKTTTQHWRKSSITTKFGTAFGLLLALIVLVSIISYAALTIVHRETNEAILI